MSDPVVSSPVSWDTVWLDVAFTISKKSKDPRTKVGAAIVSPDNRQLSVGYNGFPAGMPDLQAIWSNRDPLSDSSKYSMVIHAEENAVLNCPHRPAGWTLYCTHAPCLKCACRLIQAGITRVVYAEVIQSSPTLETSRALDVLRMAGIRLEHRSPHGL